MKTVHITNRSEQSEYTPQNTKEIVHFKEATNSNLNPRIGKSMVSLVSSSTSNEQIVLHHSLKSHVFSSKTNVNKSLLLINHEII